MNNIRKKRDWGIFKWNNSSDLNNLNKLNTDIHYEKKSNTQAYCILKKFYDKYSFDKELYTIIFLKKTHLNIIPEITHIDYYNNIIEYNFTNLLPLKNILQSHHSNIHLIINELLSFIMSIQFKKIIIGYLNIENIYINLSTMQFYIIDLSNIKTTNLNIELESNLKSLFNSFYYANIKHKILTYIKQEFDIFIKTRNINSVIDLYITNVNT